MHESEEVSERLGVAEEGERFGDDPGLQPYDPGDIPPDRQVITTPADYPVKSLLDEIQNKNLIVNPGFQRRDVWDRVKKSRLIESLLLNIPIPVVFLAEDEDGTRVVVDGQQRLRAIEQYVAGGYALNGLEVLSSLNRKRWVDLTPKQSRVIMQRALRCIVISSLSDPNLRFEVFERLNTGGVTLNDQELRNCIYRGPFNTMLNDLAKDGNWLKLLQRPRDDDRLQHHEMILRFLAMRNRVETYRPPLKSWLSDFMKENRVASEERLSQFRLDFQRAVGAVALVFGGPESEAFRRVRAVEGGSIQWDRTLNRPVFELQMLGLIDAPVETLRAKAVAIRTSFAKLSLEDEAFADALSRATADRTRTRLRLERWGNALTGLSVPNELPARLPSLS
jgi:hypothetical protein